jgi:hypothetical protein
VDAACRRATASLKSPLWRSEPSSQKSATPNCGSIWSVFRACAIAFHLEGDHRVHAIKVFKNHLQLDSRFDLDLNTAFATGPARPHGIETK